MTRGREHEKRGGGGQNGGRFSHAIPPDFSLSALKELNFPSLVKASIVATTRSARALDSPHPEGRARLRASHRKFGRPGRYPRGPITRRRAPPWRRGRGK